MKYFPKSVSDYEFPAHLRSSWIAPLRWSLSGVFYVGFALGSAVRLIAETFNIPRQECRPTMVLRTDGIGDALLFEPALESLARTVSPSEVHLWAPKATCDLFIECPTITKRIVVPRGFKSGNLQTFFSLLWRARLGYAMARHSYEKAVYPVESPEPLGNWIFESVRAAERWVNWGDLQNQFDWQRARTHEAATMVIEQRPGSAHELQRNEYLADQWAEERKLRKPRIYLKPESAKRADQTHANWRRAANRIDAGDLVGIVVAGTSRANNYPIYEWAEVLRRLWEEHRAIGVLLGGPGDQALMDELVERLDGVPSFRFEKAPRLLTTAAMIRRMDAVLSVDTGLAHIAMAMRRPTVVLVAGRHPGRFFPWPGASSHIALDASATELQSSPSVASIRPDEIVDAYVSLRTAREYTTDAFTQPEAISIPMRRIAG